MQHGLGTAQCMPLLSQLKSRLVPITGHAALVFTWHNNVINQGQVALMVLLNSAATLH